MKEKLKSLYKRLSASSKLVAILAVLLHCFVFFWNIDDSHDWGDDFALYIDQAIAISNGETQELYEINKSGMHLSEKRIGPDLYPPGYPLLLVPIYLLFGKSFIAFKVLNLLLFLGILYLLPLVLNYWGHKKKAYWLVAYLAALPFFMHFEHEIISDLAAWFFALLGLYYFLISQKNYSWQAALICGLAVAYSLLVKSLAFTLIGAMFASLAIDYLAKRNRQALKTSAFLLLGLVLIWLPSKLFYPSVDSSYVEQLVQITPTWLYENLVYNFYLPRTLMFDMNWLYYPFALLFLIGLFKNIANRKFSIALWFFLLHLILLCLWPYHEGPRFMFILIPILILLSFEGFQVIQSINPNIAAIIGLVYLSFLFKAEAKNLYLLKNPKMRPGLNQACDQDANEVWEFIRKETEQKDTIIFFKPRALKLFTNRIGFRHSKKKEAEKLHPKYYIKVKIHGGFEDSTYISRFENKRFTIYEIPQGSR